MKTERQQLEENRDRQFAEERFQELSEYMAHLIKVIAEQLDLHRRSAKLEIAALLTFAVTIFSPSEILPELAWLLFLFTMFRNWIYIYPKLVRADAELDGVFKTLECLGMKDRGDGTRKKRKRINYVHPFAGIPAQWDRLKSKLRKEAYA